MSAELGGEPGKAGPAGESAVDAVVQQIRNLIASSKLKVGDHLPTERDLCAQFNASRNTVREAMRILKAYGLVDVRPKIGATITDNRMTRAFELFSFNTMEISRKTFSDVQAFRSLIEVGSADLFFDRLRQEDLDDLSEINASLAENHDLNEASEIDFAFHVRLVSILDNHAVLDVYAVMKPVILRIMQKGKTRRTFMTETFSEHQDVVDALAARDRLAFQYRLRSHLMIGFRFFSEEMEESA
ncbi:FadR/GntR family transcriptional regulator [Roseibium marinum]|uniref:DNA-binding FadR family transcriptional regulator n=1 Tax=Roseibium marinum TaxID=281252 RepID=A0A2S3UPK9_9HYPH|nr:GntR family transcriptional regulator [Roseibium marinum]POF29655.1 DNA-binding FadR family transcriptional regulator [Roseibium marinum]